MVDGNDSDDLFFAEDDTETAGSALTKIDNRWKVLIVDDEQEIHHVTKLVLNKFVFLGRGIYTISAMSGQEAREVIKKEKDIALILLDVVMETDHAGLDVVKFIREEIQNHAVRIVLRTGQPGQAPEREVIEHFDINDYKNKTELTAEKLFTLICTALRSYVGIMKIIRSKLGMQQVLEDSKLLFRCRNIRQFSDETLREVTDLLSSLAVQCVKESLSAMFIHHTYEGQFVVINATGEYVDVIDGEPPSSALEKINALNQAESVYEVDKLIFVVQPVSVGRHIIYIKLHTVLELDDLVHQLLELYFSNVVVALDNLYLNREIEETAREMMYRLGEAVETRSKETGNHVKRVALISELLAKKINLPEYQVELIKLASPMHDLGKISIPDAILNKPSKLEPDEWEIMKTHAEIGYEILKGSKRPVIQYASTIAHEHHEKWNGEGYPRGLAGEAIHIAGRITAVADVFDALASERCYKKAWPLEKVLEFFTQEKGKHFDPTLVDILFRDLPEFIAIRDKYAE